MRKAKRILAFALSLVVVFSGINYAAITSNEVAAATVSTTEWTNNGLISPANGSLIGAGYIDVKWNNNLEGVSSYAVYVDNALIGTVSPTSAETLSCEFYTVDVSAHTAYVSATLTNGTVVNTNTSTFYVTKKGICINEDMGVGIDASSLNVGWYYNWGFTAYNEKNFKNRSFDNMDYVPMIWGQGTVKEAAFENAKKNGYKYILGYNEPDLTNQSNMSIEKVINRWQDFCNSGLKVGSPATATAPCWSDKWFKPFMEKISANSSLDVDFIAVHCYWGTDLDSTKGALQFLQAIDQTYALYHKPIWITEFAVGEQHMNLSMADPTCAANTRNFLKIVLEGLNARSYVERYAWFSFDPEDNSKFTDSASGLWYRNTGVLTELGKLYAEIGNPVGYPAKTYGVYTPSGVDTSAVACAASVKPVIYTALANNKKKTIKLNLKSVNNAAGYEIKYSTYKNMKKAKTKSTTKLTYVLKKLKAGKKYYVQSRAYFIMDGSKLYTGWSSKKVAKIKKVKKVKKAKKAKSAKNSKKK